MNGSGAWSGLEVGRAVLVLSFLALLLAPLEPLPWSSVLPWGWCAACGVFALAAFALSWPNRPDRFSVTPLDLLLGLYLLAVLATFAWTTDRAVSLPWFVFLCAHVAVFYALRMLLAADRRVGRLLLAGLVVGIGFLQLDAAVWHLAAGLDSRPTVYLRPELWIGRPELSLLAVMQLGVLVAAWLEFGSPVARAAVLVLLLVNLGELAFLYARLGWFAAAGIVLAAGIHAIRSRRQLPYVILVIPLLVVSAGATWSSPALRALARSAVGLQRTEAATPQMRLDLWTRTAEMIRDYPAGVGLGNFTAIYEPNYNPMLNPDGRRGVHPHNLWLHQAAEVGLVGGVLYAALWVVALGVGWWRAGAGGSGVRIVPLAGWLALVGTAIYAVADGLFFALNGARVRIHTLVWLLIALAVSRALEARPEQAYSAEMPPGGRR